MRPEKIVVPTVGTETSRNAVEIVVVVVRSPGRAFDCPVTIVSTT